MTTPPTRSVVVLGTSLAGLTAAYELARLGYTIAILDDRGGPTDLLSQPPNQPTYVLSCYQETLALLQSLDAGSRNAPQDTELPLSFQRSDGQIASYRSSRLPGPVHWLWGLAKFTGLSRADRWRLLSYLEQLWEEAVALPSDLAQRVADEWLISAGQSQEARETIWAPLALWLTGNRLTDVSAAVYVEILAKAFLARQPFAGIAQLSGSSLEGDVTEGPYDRFTTPLTRSLQIMGADIRPFGESHQLQFEGQRVAGIRFPNGRVHKAEWYIAALPRRKLLALLPERLLTRYAYFSQMDNLRDLPGLTLRFTCQWVSQAPRLLLLPRRSFHQLSLTPFGPVFTNVRLSTMSNPIVEAMSEAGIREIAQTELRTVLPELPADSIRSVDIIREEHASLSLQPGTAMLRPIQRSPIHNLLVAGSWTDTGWPANVESAVVSAKRCVEIIAGRSA